jgi:sigma-B regulation protein RsbU (phosphoserine phosphatase)
MHLMPGIAPRIPGLDAALHFQPSSELGGDLYEFLSYGRDRQVIIVGDVSGKGAPAALYGAMASGTLRSLAPLKLPAPDMMKRLNVMFLERKIEGHFITLTYAIWEPRTKSLTLANAGMPLPILVRKGQCRSIRAEGVPLGLLEHTEYQPVTVNLESGDLLAFFSDGITEANDLQQDEFGSRRLENILRENAQKPPHEIVSRVFKELKTFEAGRPQRDDQTLVILKVR